MGKQKLYTYKQSMAPGEILVGIAGPAQSGKIIFLNRFTERMTESELQGQTQGAISFPFYDEASIQVRFVEAVGKAVNSLTAALVVTEDGSFEETSRESILEEEKQAIFAMQKTGKPFLVLINSIRPYSQEARSVATWIASTFGVHTEILNCEQASPDDFRHVIEQLFGEFPLQRVYFRLPKWVETLDNSHWLKQSLFSTVKKVMSSLRIMRDLSEWEQPEIASASGIPPEGGAPFVDSGKHSFKEFISENQYITKVRLAGIRLDEGSAEIQVLFPDTLYYEILSEMTGVTINSEYQLISLLREVPDMKEEYEKASEAIEAVRQSGYGVIAPQKNEIKMSEPAIIRQGNRYGVKIKAQAPSIHLLRADVVTEIEPIVGSEEQAKDLISYIKQNENGQEGAFGTLIFGKSLEQLINEGIQGKLSSVNEECQMKLQNAMKRIVNESKGRIFVILM